MLNSTVHIIVHKYFAILLQFDISTERVLITFFCISVIYMLIECGILQEMCYLYTTVSSKKNRKKYSTYTHPYYNIL